MTIDVDELERLAKAATPGPWTTKPDDDQRKHLLCTETGAWFGVVEASPRNAADAAFIAAANPAVVLELVRRLRAAEGIVRDLANKDPLVFSDSSHPFIGSDYECGCCEAMAQSKYDVEHAESCPWRRATEYVK